MSTSLKAASPHFESPYHRHTVGKLRCAPRWDFHTREFQCLLSLEKKGTAIRVEIGSVQTSRDQIDSVAISFFFFSVSFLSCKFLTVTYLFGFGYYRRPRLVYDSGRRFRDWRVFFFLNSFATSRKGNELNWEIYKGMVRHVREYNKPVYFIRWNTRIVNFSFFTKNVWKIVIRSYQLSSLEFRIIFETNPIYSYTNFSTIL